MIMLRGASENKTFAQLCELLVEYSDEPEQVPMQAASILKTWLMHGLITELKYD